MVVATYLIFPETAGRSLEEMDAIFEQASVWNPYDVVKIEKRTPRRYDTKGRPLQLEGGVAEDGYGKSDEKDAEKVTTPVETHTASSADSQ
jgi:hypothetical protein